jgi:hypothetical protein
LFFEEAIYLTSEEKGQNRKENKQEGDNPPTPQEKPPIRMIEPLPYLRSIWLMAAASAFSFSGERIMICEPPCDVLTRASAIKNARKSTYRFLPALSDLRLSVGATLDAGIIARGFVSHKWAIWFA